MASPTPHAAAGRQPVTLPSHTDKDLFGKGLESYLGDCPICFLKLPLSNKESTFMPCCSKTICDGCLFAKHEAELDGVCSFCREPSSSKSNSRVLELTQARVDAKDAEAIGRLAGFYHNGLHGLPKDEDTAMELWEESANLGSVNSRYNLAVMHDTGIVVEKDMKAAMHHYENAAMGGHHLARYALGFFEAKRGDTKRALKHLKISVKMGCDKSLELIDDLFRAKANGVSSNQVSLAYIRYDAAIDSMKSDQRTRAKEYFESSGYYEREMSYRDRVAMEEEAKREAVMGALPSWMRDFIPPY